MLVIIDDVDGEALPTLVLNKIHDTFNVVAVKAPGFGDRRKAILGDITTLAGGTVVSSDLGLESKDTKIDQLDKAGKVTVTEDSTTIVEGANSKDTISKRVDQVKKQAADTASDFDREKLQERLAKLTGGIAIIRVDAATETELEEREYRIEDALNATRATIEEGYVTGGGTALVDVMKSIQGNVKGDSQDAQTDVNAVMKVLGTPVRQIAENADKDGAVILDHLEHGDPEIGYNAATDRWKNMVKAGIIDLTKITRSALQDAASIAALLLTTEAVVADAPGDDKSQAPVAPNPGMGMGM